MIYSEFSREAEPVGYRCRRGRRSCDWLWAKELVHVQVRGTFEISVVDYKFRWDFCVVVLTVLSLLGTLTLLLRLSCILGNHFI